MPNLADTRPAELLYPDLDHELATTRKFLALVPDGKNDWRPDAKSYTLGALATHLVDLVGFGSRIITTSEMDFAKEPWVNRTIDTRDERLSEFDVAAASLTKTVNDTTWDSLEKEWKMCAGDTVYVSDAKRKLVRNFFMSHSTHHRAQLGVYLRLLGIPIPGAYGPSADES